MALSWDDTLDNVKGLGNLRTRFLNDQGFYSVGDLLLRAPLRFIDRRESPPFNKLSPPPQTEITAIGTIQSFGEKGKQFKRRLIVIIGDGTGFISGVWFNNYKYIVPKLEPGKLVMFSGKVGFYDGPQMVHPQVTFLGDDFDISSKTGLLPVYPSGEGWDKVGLSRKVFPRLIQNVVDQWDGSGLYIPEEIQKEENLVGLKEAVTGIHFPETVDQFDSAIKSLKFAELFYHQALMVALRRRRRQGDGFQIEKGKFYDGLAKAFPFELSISQRSILDHVLSDMASTRPMYRLIQGEVGSGKTVVALLAAAIAADAGFQTALMAPTEMLARQHYRKAMEWCEPVGMNATLVTGGRDPDEKRRALYEAATGNANIIIGTHALFQKNVKLPHLGLVIIDEQQRFGVRQRAKLVKKGVRPHVLLMTATPIPRSLALVYYGDLDISYLLPPPGRVRKVKTKVVNDSKRDSVFEWLRGEIGKGEKAYLIFPVIEGNETGLEAVEKRFKPYQTIDFKGIPMALAHGRVPVEQRQKALDDFAKGDVKLLAATSVVEVGVDVPDANIMVIENSERFGLSQLHQLRGRIGRSGDKAYCILITRELPEEDGYKRLQKLVECDDGLTLAEEDLKLRGSGDPLGAEQSGMVRFKLADLSTDMTLLKRAHKAAERLLDKYPDLAPFPDLRAKLRQDYRERPKTLMAG